MPNSHNRSSPNASERRQEPNETVSDFKPLFQELFDGARYDRINPFSCIRLTKIRPVTSGGVKRLKSLFLEDNTTSDDVCGTGLTFGTNSPIVVELSGAFQQHLVERFKEQQLNEDQILEAINRFDKWYGIIDGAHANEAVKQLSSTSPSWKGFEWFVTVLAGGHPLERYRQLARAQNSRHSLRHYVEFTLYDELYNLRLEYENLLRLQKKPTQIHVARAYFGSNFVSSTRKYMASMALRLSSETITTLGKIMNIEAPNECLRHECFDSNGAKSVEEAISLVDCRIYKKFVCLHSLRMSTMFMTAKTPAEQKAQIYTLYRAKEYCLLNALKTVQYTIINQQFKMALLAISEEKKFLKYLGSDEWPVGMETTKDNLLNSTVMDSEVEGNKGNENTILSSLKNALLSINPNLVKRCDEALKVRTELDRPSDTAPVNDNGSPNTISQNHPSDNLENPVNPVNDIPEIPNADNEVMELKNNLESLQTHGIECVNMDWRRFLSSAWSSDRPRADTIVTEPPPISSRSFLGPEVTYGSRNVEQELSEEEVSSMPVLSKRILKPGGYVVLIMKFEAFGEWFRSFRKAGYTVMPYPYVFGYDPESVQDRNPSFFPQPGSDYGLLAYYPTNNNNETGFRPDFKSSFCHIWSQKKRHLSIMSDIPAPKSKLCRGNSRSPFLASEKSVKMVMEAIDLFTPIGGLTIDMFGGTMTTPIAALIKRRRCLCIEQELCLFKAAVTRLILCLPSTNMINDNNISLFQDTQNDIMDTTDHEIHCSSDETREGSDEEENSSALNSEDTIETELPHPNSSSVTQSEELHQSCGSNVNVDISEQTRCDEISNAIDNTGLEMLASYAEKTSNSKNQQTKRV